MRTRACLGAAVIVAAIGIGSNPASALLSARASGPDGWLHGNSIPTTVQAAPRGPFALCPVGRPHHFRDDFGEPRYVGGFHGHQGIDIFARRGTRVFAPFDGKAVASFSWAGGLQVYLYRPDGSFVFNAHLSRTGHGGKVEAGTVIGYVGNTGDAMGGSTHDHFEWHPRGGRAIDGFPFLTMVCT